MAGFTTHYIFGEEMVSRLKDMPNYDLIMRYRNVYNLGLQGPDIFFYNIFISGGRSRYKFGKMMHKYNTNIFFDSAIDYINNLYYNENKCDVNKEIEYMKEILSVYLLGFFAHHALDTSVHPYVYSRASYLPEKDNSDESFGMHSLIEVILDKKYLISKKKIMPSKFYQHKTVALSKDEKKVIVDFLTYCIIQTYYKKKNNDYNFIRFVRQHVKLSINIHRFFLLILHDKYGFKRKIAQIFEKYFLGHVALSNIILTDKLTDTVDAMNTKHKKWHHPWDQITSSTESFHELYKKAGSYYIQLVNEITKSKDGCFIKKCSKDHILDLINDRSYHSGLKSENY